MDSFLNYRSIYLANGVGIFLLLMLQYTSKARINRHYVEDRLYTFMVTGVMGGCFMEMFSYSIDGKVFPGCIVLNHIANTYLYTINLLLPFTVLVYVDYVYYGDLKRIWKHYKPQIIIGVIMYVINIVNLFIPLSYHITEQNVYERRPIGYVYYVVILFYCLTALFVSKRYEKNNGARAFFSIEMFLLPIFLGAGLQFMFYGLSIAWLSAAVGLTGLYMMQQNEMAYIDSLVDVYNRQYLTHTLTAWERRGSKFAGVMADIDHFKQINDQFGHSEGDRALVIVTNKLKESRRDDEWVFRLAGDEFIILKLTDSTDGLAPYMEEVQRRLDQYNSTNPPYLINLSYGTSFFNHGNIDVFMKQMDDNMYKMKSEHHSKR